MTTHIALKFLTRTGNTLVHLNNKLWTQHEQQSIEALAKWHFQQYNIICIVPTCWILSFICDEIAKPIGAVAKKNGTRVMREDYNYISFAWTVLCLLEYCDLLIFPVIISWCTARCRCFSNSIMCCYLLACSRLQKSVTSGPVSQDTCTLDTSDPNNLTGHGTPTPLIIRKYYIRNHKMKTEHKLFNYVHSFQPYSETMHAL